MQNKKTPLISVIMNCHNGEKFLVKSLNSLLKQSYKNWELIFLDNFSDDKSKKIVSNFRDKRIKIFSTNKKVKLYHARNLAINKSKGKYISFLDVDDAWKKNKLQSQINFLIRNKEFKLVYSNYYVLSEKKKLRYIKFKKNFDSGFVTQNLLNEYSIGILTILIETKTMKKNLFNKKYNIIGDFDCFIKLSLKNKIAYLKEPLAFYRIHDNNYSIKNLSEYIQELSYWIKNYKRLFVSFSFLNLHILLFKLKVKVILNIFFGRVVQW